MMQRQAALVRALLTPSSLMPTRTIALAGRMADRQPTHVLVCTGRVLLAPSFALTVTVELHSTLRVVIASVVLVCVVPGFILPSLHLV